MEEQFDEIEKDLWGKLGELTPPEPNTEIKTRFYAMLDTFKKEEEAKKDSLFEKIASRIKDLFAFKPAFNWAYSLVLALVFGLVGYLIGKPGSQQMASEESLKVLSSEVQELKQTMMLSMLENPMATERMKAVGYTQELKTVDDQVIEALFTTLNFDQNENVRISTVEALVELADNPRVREGLVQSLMKQESPLVQVALADAMVKLQEKGSVKQMKQLLQKQNLNKLVKNKFEKSIKALI